MLLPWWLNFLITILSLSSPYLFKVFLLDKQINNVIFLEKLNLVLFQYHLWIGGFFAVLTLITYFIDKKSERLFYAVNSLQDLKNISWEDFELVVGETFRKDGYSVTQRGGAQADGGIDLEAHKVFSRTIVQCKHWKKSQVGVQIVREMYGVLIHEGAKEVYIVTCGKFSKDAKEFAKNKPIILVDGKELLEWMDDIKG